MRMHNVPSLVDLCVQTATDNVRYLGDVGETDYHLLERILPHCTLDQLMHIENSTEDRDLTPVTDKLWKKFYQRQFGVDSTNNVVEKMQKRNITFAWKLLYEAKLKDREEATQKSFDRIRQRYQEENARKQSRQVQLCMKVPPSSRKRSFQGVTTSSIGNTKSSLMKKAKLDFVNSREFKNLETMKKNKVVQRNYSVPSIRKPSASSGFAASSSSSKLAKPSLRRFRI